MTAELPRACQIESPLGALDAASVGEWECDLRQRSVRLSPRMEALLGIDGMSRPWSLEEVLHCFLSEDRRGVLDAFSDARTGEALEFEQRICRRNDGALRWMHVRGRLFRSHGDVVACAGVATDVTDWRMREDQRRQGEKMEAIGDLCKRIAHDYNNFLMAIGTNFEMYEELPAGSDRAGRFLAAAHEGLRQSARFNQRLTEFSAQQVLRLRKVGIEDLLRTCKDAIGAQAGSKIKIEWPSRFELLSCRVDIDKFRTAMLNLISNARDAMPDGGILTLSVSRREVGRRDAVACGVSAGDYVVVGVDDTGTGIEGSAFPHLFEPFFTTKRDRGAKGVGLNEVYGLVRQCGGFVTVEAGAQGGTSIKMQLPQVA